MAKYEVYLEILGHTTDSVAKEKNALENEIRSLSEKLVKQKQENNRPTSDIKNF